MHAAVIDTPNMNTLMVVLVTLAAIAWVGVGAEQLTAKAETAAEEREVAGIQPALYVNLGGDFYYFSAEAVTVTVLEATRLCNDDGMRLVSLETAEKNQLIKDFLTQEGRISIAYIPHEWRVVPGSVEVVGLRQDLQLHCCKLASQTK